MSMRHTSALVAASLILLLAPATATATESGWSLGFGWGEADYGVTVRDFDDGSITTGRVDSNELGWKVHVGYRFNTHLAIEVGYVDLVNDFDGPTFEGLSDGNGSHFVSLPDGPVSLGVSPRGYFVDGVGILPIGESWSVLGRAGVVFYEADAETRDLIGEILRRNAGTALHFGAGLEYAWPNGLAVRGEYELFTSVWNWDIDLLTAGVSYRF